MTNLREYVQGLEKGLPVLRAFRPEDKSLTVAQVARRTMLDRAVARRHLLTLEQLGYLSRPGEWPVRKYSHAPFSITPHVLVLIQGLPAAGRVLADADAQQAAQPEGEVQP
nr:helix-turn-helix domain-containing protein [uncultured Roseateles sp.]